ncbi:MAG: hypothetical protein ACFE85_09000 [Candidatus Hodarchaeota archaeon]
MKNSRRYILGIFVLGLLIFTINIGTVAASDNDDDGINDDFEESSKRDIEVEFSANEFQIETVLRNGEPKDSIEFRIRYESEGLEVKVSYESEYLSENSTESEIEFEVTFRKLIEFVDLNGNGIYDKSTDDTIQEVALDSFQPLIYSTSTIASDTVLHYFIVNTTDGVFAAHIFLVEEFEIVNDTLITPTQTKIDIEINNFNYLNDTSQLALYTKLESGVEYEDDDETEDEKEGYTSNEDGVITRNLNYAGIFAWKEVALVDGLSETVLSSTIEIDDDDENEQKLYLNYPRGDHIYHDPKVGIALLGSDFPWVPLILVMGSIAIIGVTVAVFLVTRRKKRIS